MSFANDVMLLIQAANDVDSSELEPTLDRNLIALAMLREARQTLMYAERDKEQKIAALMSDKRVTVDGVATFEKRFKKNRTQWDTDDLLRAVLDSRIVDEETGEIREETQLERVLHVFNLPAPRLTALKARGIDADQFCHSEPAGYGIQVIN